MTNTTVAEFAAELRKSPEAIVEQLRSAGVEKGPEEVITEADKYALLRFLKAQHGTIEPERKKITIVKGDKSFTKVAPSATDIARREAFHAAYADTLRRCVEVSSRGKRALLIRERNGELTRLDLNEDRTGFPALPNKVILVGSYLSDAFEAFAQSLLTVVQPRTLNKVLSNFLWAVGRAVPASQRGLCSKSNRIRSAHLVGAANDLVRFEHVYPACAATISLA